jgi:hypothetical protein
MARHLLLALIALCACSSTRDESPVKQRPVVSQEAPAVAIEDDDGCMADTAHVHSAPRALLEAFLERDGRGDFMRTDRWNATAVECPGHTPGWDEATVVTNWTVTTLMEHQDTAQYAVAFSRYGRTSQDTVGLYLVAGPSTETDTVTLVRKAYGWRIGGYQYNPHVLPAALRGQRNLRARDEHILDSLIASGSRSSRPGA